MEQHWEALASTQRQLVALAIFGTAALEMLVAVWAAVSRRHWFVRALAVWGAIALLVPIRAYEPALLFAISSPLVVAILCGWRVIAARRSPAQAASPNELPHAPMRFGVRDLFLLLALVGLSLAVLIEIVRHLRPINWPALAAYVAVLVSLAIGFSAVAIGKRRRVAAAIGGVGAIAGSMGLIWISPDWLMIGHHFFEIMIAILSGLFGQANTVAQEAWTAELVLVLLAILLLLGLANQTRIASVRTMANSLLAAAALLNLLFFSLVYWKLFWLTPLPPRLTIEPNHYPRIIAIAKEVAASKQDDVSIADVRAAAPDSDVAVRLERLYAELLPLLDASNAVVLPPATLDTNVDSFGPVVDSVQAARSLARSLSAESKQAAAVGDVDKATKWALANVRLGSMLSREGTTVELLVGVAIEGVGTMQLATLRERLSPEQSRAVIAALERAVAEHQAPETVRQRDIAYCERWDGWTVRLSNAITELQGKEPGTDPTPADARRVATFRLLQADLAVRLFHAKHGRWPNSLTELVPEQLPQEPLDPYSGKPIGYRTDGDELVVYSVGEDGIDDGGKFGSSLEYHRGGYDLDLDMHSRP